jgi:hypothetical protein
MGGQILAAAALVALGDHPKGYKITLVKELFKQCAKFARQARKEIYELDIEIAETTAVNVYSAAGGAYFDIAESRYVGAGKFILFNLKGQGPETFASVAWAAVFLE